MAQKRKHVCNEDEEGKEEEEVEEEKQKGRKKTRVEVRGSE